MCGSFPAMSGIGVVMFGKALVLALWLFIVDRWNAYRASRVLTLRQNRQGVFVANDWTATVNNAFRYARNTIYVVMVLWWIVLAYLLTRG
jgi:hypothetical protein